MDSGGVLTEVAFILAGLAILACILSLPIAEALVMLGLSVVLAWFIIETIMTL